LLAGGFAQDAVEIGRDVAQCVLHGAYIVGRQCRHVNSSGAGAPAPKTLTPTLSRNGRGRPLPPRRPPCSRTSTTSSRCRLERLGDEGGGPVPSPPGGEG
jgi:hypothetical protein